MKDLKYYTPVIKPVTEEERERLQKEVNTVFNFKALTYYWGEDGPERKKRKFESFGKTRDECYSKIKAFFIGSEEVECEYYLCSKDVVEKMQPFEVSKEIKTGYENDEVYHVAWLNFEETKEYYDFHIRNNDSAEWWMANECVPGTMNVNELDIKEAKEKGLFIEIEEKLGLENRAMIITELANKNSMTPVEFVNKYL